MTEEEFDAVRQQGGVYGAMFQMNTAGVEAAIAQDKWLRNCIVAFAFVAFAAMGMAWRNVARSGEIELRLFPYPRAKRPPEGHEHGRCRVGP